MLDLDYEVKAIEFDLIRINWLKYELEINESQHGVLPCLLVIGFEQVVRNNGVNVGTKNNHVNPKSMSIKQ